MKKKAEHTKLILAIILLFSLLPLHTQKVVSYSKKASLSNNYSFSASALDGAGGQNVVAFDPHQKDYILAGGDCNGFHISQDGGKNWLPANEGLTDHHKFGIGAILFSNTTPGLVYAGVGRTNGTGGAFLRSLNSGKSWEVMSEDIQFSGAKNRSIVKTGASRLPSSVGKLIVFDEVQNILYVGTLKQGIFKSQDSGKTWEYIGLKNKWIRSLALTSDGSSLFIGTFGEGLFQLKLGQQNMLPVKASPKTIEDMFYLEDSKELWLATSADGIMVLNHQNEWSLKYKGSGDEINGPFWNTLLLTTSQIFAGCHMPSYDALRKNYSTLIQSKDKGLSWENAIHEVSHKQYGDPEESWWKEDQRAMIQGKPFQGVTPLGRVQSKISDIAVDPYHPEKTIITSNGGLYISEDYGNHWQFASKGMQLVVPVALSLAPWGELFLGMKDWGYVIANQDSTAILQWNRYASPMMMATDFAFDPDGSKFYALLSPNDTGGGYILSGEKANPQLNIFMDLHSITDQKEGRPIKMLKDPTTSKDVFIVAVVPPKPDNSKAYSRFYRTEDGKNWTLLHEIPSDNGDFNLSMHWSGGKQALYVYHSKKGFFKAENGGQGTWSQPFSLPPVASTYSGFMTTSKTNPDQLYIASDSGLYHINHANLPKPCLSKISLGHDLALGPLSTDTSGNIFLTVPAQKGKSAQLLFIDPSMTIANIADDFYRSSSLFPRAIAISQEGTLIIANQVNGYTVGKVNPGKTNPNPQTYFP